MRRRVPKTPEQQAWERETGWTIEEWRFWQDVERELVRRPRLPRGFAKLSRAAKKRIRAQLEEQERTRKVFLEPGRPPGVDFDPVDDPGRQKLILKHLAWAKRIARHVAGECLGRGERGTVDCETAALQGLAEAAWSYDDSRGTPFEAYARKRVQGAVRDAIRSERQTERTRVADADDFYEQLQGKKLGRVRPEGFGPDGSGPDD